MKEEKKNSDSLISLFETKKSLTITLLRARESLMMSFRPLLAKHNFTEQQWRVLRVLGEKGPCDAGQLATEACILSPSLSRIINTLIENNFIIKKEDKSDKRKIILEISDEGKIKLESIKPEYLAILKSIQKRYGEDKINKILNSMRDRGPDGKDYKILDNNNFYLANKNNKNFITYYNGHDFIYEHSSKFKDKLCNNIMEQLEEWFNEYNNKLLKNKKKITQ